MSPYRRKAEQLEPQQHPDVLARRELLLLRIKYFLFHSIVIGLCIWLRDWLEGPLGLCVLMGFVPLSLLYYSYSLDRITVLRCELMTLWLKQLPVSTCHICGARDEPCDSGLHS